MTKTTFIMQRLLAVLAFVTAIAVCSITSAEVIVQAESKTVTSATSSSVSSFFDVYFGGTPGGTNPLAGFQIRLDLSPSNGGITFGSPENAFATPARLAALPSAAMFDTTGSDADTILASAFVNAGSEQAIDNGDGLIRVPFTVAPGTTGTFNVIIDQPNTLLSDALGNPIGYQAVNGTITVVPEPGTMVLIAFAAASFAWFNLRSVRRPHVKWG